MERKIPEANYTMVPNVILGNPYGKGTKGIMAELTPYEALVLLVICRATFGYGKEKNRMSYTKISEMTGIARSTVQKHAATLEEKGYIHKETDGGVTWWAISVDVPRDGTGIPCDGTPSNKENNKENIGEKTRNILSAEVQDLISDKQYDKFVDIRAGLTMYKGKTRDWVSLFSALFELEAPVVFNGTKNTVQRWVKSANEFMSAVGERDPFVELYKCWHKISAENEIDVYGPNSILFLLPKIFSYKLERGDWGTTKKTTKQSVQW